MKLTDLVILTIIALRLFTLDLFRQNVGINADFYSAVISTQTGKLSK